MRIYEICNDGYPGAVRDIADGDGHGSSWTPVEPPHADVRWVAGAWVPAPARLAIPRSVPVSPTVLADEIRQKRNALLAGCDWTQVQDAPVDQITWAVYRQALRDVTSQPEFPFSVTWPEPPGA